MADDRAAFEGIQHGPGTHRHAYVKGCTDECDNRACPLDLHHEVCTDECDHLPWCTCYGCEDWELSHDE